MLIKRSLWICGFPSSNQVKGTFLGEGNTELLNKEGYMDVLGFFCKYLGIKLSTGKILPSDLKSKKTEGILTKNGEDTRLVHDLMNVNDSRMPNKEREERLTAILNRHGYKLEIKD